LKEVNTRKSIVRGESGSSWGNNLAFKKSPKEEDALVNGERENRLKGAGNVEG